MNKFFIGNRVRIIDSPNITGTISATGRFYTVDWDDDDRVSYGWDESIELIPDQKEKEVSETKLKVGDKVRFNPGQLVGDKLDHLVSYIDDKGFIRLDGQHVGWYEYRFEKIEEMNEPKFKVGDTVIATEGSLKDLRLTVSNVDHIYSFKDTALRSSERNLRKVEKKEKPVFKPKFKVGDRVFAGGTKGTVEAVCQNGGRLNKVRYDTGGWDNFHDGQVDFLEESRE